MFISCTCSLETWLGAGLQIRVDPYICVCVYDHFPSWLSPFMSISCFWSMPASSIYADDCESHRILENIVACIEAAVEASFRRLGRRAQIRLCSHMLRPQDILCSGRAMMRLVPCISNTVF